MIKARRLFVPEDLTRIEEIWKGLCKRCDSSFFLSWSWMENWLLTLPQGARPELLVFEDKGKIVSAFFIKRQRRLSVKRIHLNSIGRYPFDNIWIEYNKTLCNPGLALDGFLASIPYEWDEFILPGLDADDFPGNSLDLLGQEYRVIIDNESASPFVELDKVRRNNDYISLLGSKTRAHIRRSYRHFATIGPVERVVADSIESALAIFEELVELHQQKWAKRRMPGAFSPDYMMKFHRRLIEKYFEKGEIQLMKVTAGKTTVGCIYNFVYRGCVLNYQNGINYIFGKRIQPGLVCHAEVVAYNTEKGEKIYDFLGGDTEYKRRLSTGENRLCWARIERKSGKMRLVAGLKKLKRRVS